MLKFMNKRDLINVKQHTDPYVQQQMSYIFILKSIMSEFQVSKIIHGQERYLGASLA